MEHILSQYTTPELQKLLLRAGSYTAFRRMMGLSTREFVELRDQRRELTLNVLSSWTRDQFVSELRRLGSVRIFCALYDAKESEVRSLAIMWMVDLKKFSSPVAATTGTGRKGELFFKDVRGGNIVRDCFEDDGHTHPFDFLDALFGQVNVKTAERGRYRAKTRSGDPNFWHFSTKGWKDADYLVFVPLDPRGLPMNAYVAAAQDVGYCWPSFVTLTGDDFKRSNKGVVSTDHPKLFMLLPSVVAREKAARGGFKTPFLDSPSFEPMGVMGGGD